MANSPLLRSATVHRLDGDPENLARIGVLLAGGTDPNTMVWAHVAQFHASRGSGAWFIPEVGDEVVLGHLDDDPTRPVILGSLYNADDRPPYAVTPSNDTKAFVSRSRCRIEIDDDAKTITISTPAKNTVVLNDATKSVELRDEYGNVVSLTPQGISLSSAKDLSLVASGTLSLKATGSLSLESSGGDVTTKGMNISHEASMSLTAKGSASAELSASGQVTVKGAMVMIN